ncbi:MAG TPA: copper resistance protein CopC, partial [Chloroflexia bacterium]|nr:copper resistance protein CopC [Chloroflexia bacterium]
MRRRTFLSASLLAGWLWLLLGTAAGAHSLLVSSNPSAGAQLTQPPASVQMTFSEGAVPEFSSFAVIDRARHHYEVAQPPVIDPQKGVVTVALQPNLPSGVYIVQWKVVSSVDGHLTRGSFAFSVAGGAPPPSAGPAATPLPGGGAVPTPLPPVDLPTANTTGAAGTSTQPGMADIFVRWLGSLLAALLVGGAVFRVLVVPAGLARLREPRAALQARLDLRFVILALAGAWLLLITLGA